jgi:poly(hydroxyalkanoate) depolymerase family esterase
MLNLPNLSNLKGLPLPGHPASMPPDMAEALALVREGRLQEASELLMGNAATAVRPGVTRTQAQPGVRVFDLAARGFAPVQDAMSKLDVHAGDTSTAASAQRSAPSARAPGDSEPGQFGRVAFNHQGSSHPYFLYTPSTAAPTGGRPLILMLHGCTQDAQDFARGTRMNTTAETAGALVLYPTQGKKANANGCWNWFRPEDQQAGAGEPALLLAMVQHAMAAQAVDAKRVYVAGLSAGGAMAAVLAQQYPRVFAAVGVHSGLPPGAATNMMGALSAMKSGAKAGRAPLAKDGARPVPMIVLHGDADKTVHHRNAEQLLQGAAQGIATPVHTQDQGVSTDGQRYTRNCAINSTASGEVVAEHWVLHGAGHAWSGGDTRGSHASARGVNASAEMLRFFLEHPQDGT